MWFNTILFDLDDTLHDRKQTVHSFISLLVRKYAEDLQDPVDRTLEESFVALDQQGYRPREEVFEAFRNLPYWRRIPDRDGLLALWYSEFPKCAEPVTHLHEVLRFFRTRI